MDDRIHELEIQAAIMGQKVVDMEKALILANDELKERLTEMNQFRKQISDERGIYLTKESYEDKHSKIEASVSLLTQWRSNMEGRFWALGALLAGFVIVLNVALRWMK
jgi:hypothetical protein